MAWGSGTFNSCKALLERVEKNDPKLIELVILPMKVFGEKVAEREAIKSNQQQVSSSGGYKNFLCIWWDVFKVSKLLDISLYWCHPIFGWGAQRTKKFDSTRFMCLTSDDQLTSRSIVCPGRIALWKCNFTITSNRTVYWRSYRCERSEKKLF